MKKLLLFSGFLIFLLPGPLNAQNEEVQLNFYDGEYFLAEEDYQEALLAFQKAYDGGLNNANINYRIGICYINIPGEKDHAISYLEEASKNVSANYREGSINEKAADRDVWLFLGNAYRITHQLDKSIEAYNEYINVINDKNSPEVVFANKQIEACERARKVIKNPAKLEKESLGPLYNSSFDNFNPVLALNGSAMAYMTEQRFYDAVYFVEIENGRFSNAINITSQIESDGDQYVTSLSEDGTKMLLSRISNFDADIMISNYEARRWTKSENIGKPINSKFFELHACFSPDGNTIYLSSNRKGSKGGMDIFSSTLNDKGEWTEPVNLGSKINTELNEESPFICPDGKTLYFSSQGHESIGGFDIFVSEMQDDGSWSDPEPLPFPLNTTDDDIFFFPLCNEDAGYMTRYEEDGLGSGDIYRVKMSPYEETASEELQEEVVVAEQNISPNETEKKEEEIVENEEIVITEVKEPTEKEKEREIKQFEEEISIEETQTEKSRPDYSLKPVYFSFDSYSLSPSARSRLDEVAEMMKSYMEIKIEIQGHADGMGPDAYNQYLSEQRAESARNYLLKQGVSADRLSIKGFSESKPVAINRNPDGTDSFRGRKLNRRVEYKIDPGINEHVMTEEIPVPDELKIDN